MYKIISSLAFLTLSSLAIAAATESAVELKIEKMMCGACTSRIKKLLENSPGTSDVSVTLEDHTARFKCNKAAPKPCDLDKITKDLVKIGYPPKILSKK
ncbi:MAG: heavy metal-associated domain-containing protein [Bdellovibrionota bacterium]